MKAAVTLLRSLTLALAVAIVGVSRLASATTPPPATNAIPATPSVPTSTESPTNSAPAPATPSTGSNAAPASPLPERDGSRSRRTDRRRDRTDDAATTAAATASTNAPASGTDFASFQIIPDRNIFNANRSSRSARSPRETAPKPIAVDTLSLVGSMSYTKGDFAFFDGSNSEFRKVLKPGDAIAGFSLKSIGRNSAQLESEGKTIELAIGSHLRREDAGTWRLIAETARDSPSSSSRESRSGSGSGSSSTSGDSSPSAAASGGDANDILQRLMKKREQELK